MRFEASPLCELGVVRGRGEGIAMGIVQGRGEAVAVGIVEEIQVIGWPDETESFKIEIVTVL